MGQDGKGRFYKGHKTWNAGTKGQGLTGPNSGSFKKGDVPPNRKPLWSERIDAKDGYVQIKVPETDPHTGFATRYKYKHVWIYEQIHGPVPRGHVVIFKDQDKRNFEPGNLLAIKRADLARLNQAGYKEAPGELKPSILALCRLKTKIGEARRKSMGKKICSKCKREKDIGEFGIKKSNPDGRNRICLKCVRDYQTERKAKKAAEASTTQTGGKTVEIISAKVSSLALDIARIEGENAVSMQEAAKFIIASVKKELLGAVFNELRK